MTEETRNLVLAAEDAVARGQSTAALSLLPVLVEEIRRLARVESDAVEWLGAQVDPAELPPDADLHVWYVPAYEAIADDGTRTWIKDHVGIDGSCGSRRDAERVLADLQRYVTMVVRHG